MSCWKRIETDHVVMFNAAENLTAENRTRLSGLLLSNEAPTQVEESLFRKIVHDCTQEVADLDKRIEELALLVSRRDATSTTLKNHRKVLNPVRRLVADVLCEIFHWYLQLSETSAPRPGGQGIWLLAQVCQAWRAAAHSFPVLFSTVDVSFDRVLRTHGPVFLLLRQLKLSRDYPLTVSLRSARELMSTHPFFPIILSSAPQWRCLTLTIPLSSYEQLRPIKSFLTSLKSVQMRHVDAVTTSLTLDIFAMASNLHIISSLGFKGCVHIVNLSNIREYTATDMGTQSTWTPKEHLTIISRMNNLERCHLDCHGPLNPGGFRLSVPLITLRKLRGLSLHCADEHAISLLTEFNVPSLTELRLSGAVGGSAASTVQHFLRNSPCVIKQLTLQVAAKSDDVLPDLIRAFSPAVETLEIRHSADSSLTLLDSGKVLTQLVCSGSSCILPKLRTVHLECIIDPLALLSFIKSRRNEAAKCHSLLSCVNVNSFLQTSAISADLKKLQAEGFEFWELYGKGKGFTVPQTIFNWPRSTLSN